MKTVGYVANEDYDDCARFRSQNTAQQCADVMNAAYPLYLFEPELTGQEPGEYCVKYAPRQR